MRNKVESFIGAALLLVIWLLFNSACGGNSIQDSPQTETNGTTGEKIEAYSLNFSDIQSAVDSASPGDTVILPAGSNTDWGYDDEVLVTKPLTIMGQGPENTLLQLSEPNDPPGLPPHWMFKFIEVSGNINFSGITLRGIDDFEADDRLRGVSFTNCDNSVIRIWNCNFEYLTACALHIQGYPLKGVMWNCNITGSYKTGLGYGVYVYGASSDDTVPGDASWAASTSLGTEGNFFIEDCSFSNCRHMIDGVGGTRLVVRYNYLILTDPNPIENGAFNQHGWGKPSEGAELHAWRNYELYENTFDGSGKYAMKLTAPNGVIYNNTIINYSADWCYLFQICCGHPEWLDCTGSYPEPEQVQNLYYWGNTVDGYDEGEPYELDNCRSEYAPEPPGLFHLDRDYFDEEKPGYTPYPYPHPLRKYTSPIISLSTSSLEFEAATNGYNPPNQTFKISNSGEGILDWSITESAGWLNCSPILGSGDVEIILFVNPYGLSAGTYTATITASSPNADISPQYITVSLTVTDPPRILSLSPLFGQKIDLMKFIKGSIT